MGSRSVVTNTRDRSSKQLVFMVGPSTSTKRNDDNVFDFWGRASCTLTRRSRMLDPPALRMCKKKTWPSPWRKHSVSWSKSLYTGGQSSISADACSRMRGPMGAGHDCCSTFS